MTILLGFSDDNFDSDSIQDVISNRKRSSHVPEVTATTMNIRDHEKVHLYREL